MNAAVGILPVTWIVEWRYSVGFVIASGSLT